MITIRDYASDVGVSYEAVRQQVKRYSKELEGHIHQDGRKQYLDDTAVAFLNEKRAKNPVVIYDKDRGQKVQDLEAENKALLVALNAAKDRIIELQGVQAQLVAAEATQLLLEESRDEYKEQAEKKGQEAAEAALRAQEFQQALNAAEREKNAVQAEFEAYKALPWWKKIKK